MNKRALVTPRGQEPAEGWEHEARRDHQAPCDLGFVREFGFGGPVLILLTIGS